MSEQPTTRDILIATGLRALMAQGYDGAGLGPILAEAGVPKGSFYHYFASKEDFVLAVIDDYEVRYRALREAFLDARPQDPLGALLEYFGALDREFVASFPAGGCLYGILSQGMAGRSARLRARLARALHDWQAALAGMVAAAHAAGQTAAARAVPGPDPAATAALLIDLYEGAIVRAKAEGTPEALAAFRACLPALLGAAAA